MTTATKVRPMTHKGFPGGDCHIVSFEEDELGKPGMIGVMMPGVHCIGTAPWDMEIYAVSGTIHEYEGDRMIDKHGGFSLDFKKGQVVHLRVADPDTGGLNHRHPVVFRAYPARK